LTNDIDNSCDLLYSLLGDLPDRDRPIGATCLETRECEDYILEVLVLDLNGIEIVPAYFTRPKKALDGERTPVVLYNHAHGGDYVLGKDELLRGRPALQKPAYAEVLARRGISALCIDCWNFGERRGRVESQLFKELLWKGQVLWGLMVYDTLKATDYLATRPDVDPGRICSMGISMGSTMAWWHAALDERVRCCIDLCCLTDFDALIQTRALDEHALYYYVPSLLKHFTAAEINAMICPRPHLSLAGTRDPLTPPHGLDRIDNELRRVYGDAGVPENWELVRYETGHFETADMRVRIMRFLDAHLKA
jgi:dienelactone hydrolase